MKNIFVFIFVLLFAGSVNSSMAQTVVHFPDANLESEILSAIAKPSGPIYDTDLKTLTHLDVWNSPIADLTGLEYCTALIHFYLSDSRIIDLSP